MPRDTDRRLLGLWGFELSVERRRGGSDWMKFILSPKIHSLCTHDTWLGEGREKTFLFVFKGADICSACCWYKWWEVEIKCCRVCTLKACANNLIFWLSLNTSQNSYMQTTLSVYKQNSDKDVVSDKTDFLKSIFLSSGRKYENVYAVRLVGSSFHSFIALPS